MDYVLTPLNRKCETGVCHVNMINPYHKCYIYCACFVSITLPCVPIRVYPCAR